MDKRSAPRTSDETNLVALEAHKDTTRDQLRAKRRQLGATERQRQAAALARHLVPWLDVNAPRKTLTCFLSYGAEPPTGELLDTLHVGGYRIYVPVCEPARQLSWVRWYPGVEMERSAVAPINEPVGERYGVELMGEIDVVLVPAQAVDEAGDRLGQGGGYYDRFISAMNERAGSGAITQGPKLLSMVFEHEFMSAGSFPVEEFDQRVDAVVTALGVRNLTD
ncbi:5-formyltetrahydrofolate cyclo-ligase [Arthrobacter sp. MYb227]|uniref:5-formyltetrahydrofolate cyclo-ligase n=1 Tax=Arthrobacter sp. MYb227 TaxID=1848601 RepID=UPI000CFC84F8|nr:5-formyltetrahydrofolate cyclo-ligase [Arthrobacter sp. MYb227]PQZ96007.1 5-formyltetrahydrofolate cyclo-ligase [Arthrobacter sp. MYb227]